MRIVRVPTVISFGTDYKKIITLGVFSDFGQCSPILKTPEKSV